MEEAEEENKNQLSENDEKDRKNMLVVLKTLRSQAVANMEYFQVGSDTTRSRFHAIFCLLHDHLERGIEPFVDYLFRVASQYDACGVRANGYRSLLKIIQRCCITVLQITRHICVNKESMLFRSSHYCRELEAYVTTLGQLRACLVYVEKLPEWSKKGSLFADEDKLMDETADELMMEVESLNQECFYGRCLGFQYCESLQKPFRMIAIAMASFSDGFTHDTSMAKFASSVMHSGKYFMNPELRAQQVIATTTNADIGFCKAFWNITEHDFFQDLPRMVCPPVHLSQPIIIDPYSFELPRRDNKGFATILPPTAHRGQGPIYCRLISHEYREGQEQLCKKDIFSQKSAPPSPCLVIHCHGGGFVAQSSKSHETYLRHWARDLRVPILSIDYSLAPEDPFPRAVEEVFFVYAWALDNCDLLGSTGEHICICGDSAGGNLTMSICVKAIQEGIRLPDGVMAAYPAVLVRFTPTPSRLLAIMDPLLPVGILSRCLAAYAGVAESDIPKYFNAAKRRNSSHNAVVHQPQKSHKRRHSTSLTKGTKGSPVKFMVGEEEEETSIENVFCMSCQSDSPDSTLGMVANSTHGMVVDQTLCDLADKFCEEEFSEDASENTPDDCKSAAEGDTTVAKVVDGAAKCDPDTASDKSSSGDSALQGTEGEVESIFSSSDTTSQIDDKTRPICDSGNVEEGHANRLQLDLTLTEELSQQNLGTTNAPLDPNHLSSGREPGIWHTSFTPSTDSPEYFDTISANTLENSSSLSAGSLEYLDATDANSETPQFHTPGADASEDGIGSGPNIGSLADECGTDDNCDKAEGLKYDDEINKAEKDVPAVFGEKEEITSSGEGAIERCNLAAGTTLAEDSSNLNIVSGEDGGTVTESLPVGSQKVGRSEVVGDSHEEGNVDNVRSSKSASELQDGASLDITTVPRQVSCDVQTTEQEIEGVVIGCEAVEPASSGDELEEDIKSDTVDSGFSNSEEEWVVYEESDIAALRQKSESPDGAVGGTSAETQNNQTRTLARSNQPADDRAWSAWVHSTWSLSTKFPDQGSLKSHFSNFRRYMGFSNRNMNSPLRKSPSTPVMPSGSTFQPEKRNISNFKNITHPLHHFRYLPVTKDPLMSPFLASDEILKQMPPVYLMASHLDPLLDDSVMFAKKLDSLGKEVHLDVFEDVPHGFLNFVLLSKEAKKAGDTCVARIREILMRNMKNSTPKLRKLSESR